MNTREMKGSVTGRAKRAPHRGVQSKFRMIYVGMSVVSKMRRRNYMAHAHAQSQFNTRVIHFNKALNQL